jgi:hypothetical protein
MQDKAIASAAHVNEGTFDGLPYCVVVGASVTRSIPLFAMGAEKGRDEVEQAVVTSARALRQAVGRKAASGLLRGYYGTFKLVRSRRRSGRTAIYGTWVEFAEASDAQAFLRDFPMFSNHNGGIA